MQAVNTAFINEGDTVALFRDEKRVERLFTAGLPFFHEDFETVVQGWPEGGKSYHGLLENRRFWEDWLAPWVEYRQELWKPIDVGERILLIVNDFGRREGSTQEVKIDGAAIWTFRDGKIARFEAFTDRAEALRAVGLEA